MACLVVDPAGFLAKSGLLEGCDRFHQILVIFAPVMEIKVRIVCQQFAFACISDYHATANPVLVRQGSLAHQVMEPVQASKHFFRCEVESLSDPTARFTK